MMDIFDPETRSKNMSRIRGKNTKPELVVRKLIYTQGYRYRLHRKDIPGTPDLAFIGLKKLIFVHGCFWHRHPGCKYAYVPKSNIRKWQAKFDANVERDIKVMEKLENDGWQVLVIWECETKNIADLTQKLLQFLESDNS